MLNLLYIKHILPQQTMNYSIFLLKKSLKIAILTAFCAFFQNLSFFRIFLFKLAKTLLYSILIKTQLPFECPYITPKLPFDKKKTRKMLKMSLK